MIHITSGRSIIHGARHRFTPSKTVSVNQPTPKTNYRVSPELQLSESSLAKVKQAVRMVRNEKDTTSN